MGSSLEWIKISNKIGLENILTHKSTFKTMDESIRPNRELEKNVILKSMFSSVDTNIKLNNEYWKYFDFQSKGHHCMIYIYIYRYTAPTEQNIIKK